MGIRFLNRFNAFFEVIWISHLKNLNQTFPKINPARRLPSNLQQRERRSGDGEDSGGDRDRSKDCGREAS